uniref:Uncharacterized protein n=1 Tax=Calcidiscus leptoporus TaxID=127549 RepID=A0A7S0JFN1_9EUKA|mmetsp:Transcript_56329/g.129339  ORF Transcript_56329/g.129339 Transcript_56329/m.129339 type:complete len:281 (+) Transcript_56329:272-1114(+)
MKLRAKLLLVSSACAFGFGPVAECDPPETVGEYAFAFKLETIEYNYVQHEFEDKCITGGAMPDYLCYFPITIPALAAQNLTHYAWMPWSALSEYCLEHYAPHGFFVYKVGHDGLLPNEGKHIFKKIIPVDPASEEATLKFRPASSILDFAPGESELHELASSVTFDDVRCNLASLLSHFQLRFPPPQPYRATELALLPARPSAQLHRICLRKPRRSRLRLCAGGLVPIKGPFHAQHQACPHVYRVASLVHHELALLRVQEVRMGRGRSPDRAGQLRLLHL